ncbi:ATPase [Kluyvera ascorbata]|uniref:ATPase n=1 Tax=Kluyvera ascorbata TaxID=51288 RepID=UPI0028DFB94C|nr:ATPase [Kluyvera ascorbata]MDT8702897.1 ATPase [Kluyvera ascorbata]
MSDKPAGTNTLNKKDNNAVDVMHESVDIYFCTGTQELILLTPQAASALDRHAGQLMTVVNDYHTATLAYSAAVQDYGTHASDISESAGLAVKEAAVTDAENTLQQKREAMQTLLGDFAAEGAGYEEVTELIPVHRAKRNGTRSGPGKRYSYAKKGYIDKLGTGVRHRVKLKAADKASAKESIFTRNKQGDIKGINTTALKKQLTELNTSAEGIKLFSADDLISIDTTLCGWADSWNASLSVEKEMGEHVDISAGAQFLRFSSNLGASGTWEPWKGEVAVKAEFKSALTLASGAAMANYYIPDRIGWMLKWQAQGRPKPVDMGLLRVRLGISLIGFAGASAQLEGQLQVTTVGANQMVIGNRQGQLPRFHERRVTGAQFHNAREKNEDGVKVSGEIFGGAKAELKLTGAIQWLQPPIMTAHQGKTGDDAKAAAKYVDFCSISESLVGMAGAGIGGVFQCDFINGRFCFSIAASLCVGVGAKGSFEAAVDYDKLSDFAGWLVYQLYGLDYGFFEVVAERAFTAFSQISVLMFSDIKNSIESGLENLTETAISIGITFTKFVKSAELGIGASKKRNQLALNVIHNSNRLLEFTPESKGILLYLLTRHGVWDHLDINNRGDRIIPDIYHDRKQAVLVVLHSIQTQREWFQVFSHNNATGDDLAGGNLALKYMVAQNKMNELKRFLQEGLNKDDEMDKIYRNLNATPAWGYALTMNNTLPYRLFRADNPFYPCQGKFSPLSEKII